MSSSWLKSLSLYCGTLSSFSSVVSEKTCEFMAGDEDLGSISNSFFWGELKDVFDASLIKRTKSDLADFETSHRGPLKWNLRLENCSKRVPKTRFFTLLTKRAHSTLVASHNFEVFVYFE